VKMDLQWHDGEASVLQCRSVIGGRSIPGHIISFEIIITIQSLVEILQRTQLEAEQVKGQFSSTNCPRCDR
jgi:hypothetical protein